MTKDELKQFLKDNLKVSVETMPQGPWGNTRMVVTVKFDGEWICQDEDVITHSP